MDYTGVAKSQTRLSNFHFQNTSCEMLVWILSRETGISGNFVGRIKGAKCPFDLQFLTWDFP